MLTQSPKITKDELHKYIKKVGWPTAPIVIAQIAKDHGAPEDVLKAINSVPNQIYLSENAFWEEFRKVY